MNPLHHRFALSLKLLLIVTLLLSPFVAVNRSAQAAPQAQNDQPTDQDGNVVILDKVQNPDGTTTVTLRIYATPNDPNAPNTTFWTSQDTYIASGVPNGNYGSSTTMGIGFSNAGPQAMRMLLQFNLSGIPTGSTINSANIFVFQNAVSPAGDAPMGFQAQYAVSAWNEFNATWNNANFIGGAPLPIGSFPSTLGWLTFPSTNLFRNWVSGAQANNGLIITGDESPANNRSRWFTTSNASSNRPYADINFTTGCTYPAPTSSVNPLPATSPNAFTVSWTGTAFTPPGCPTNRVASYIVWYQVNNGAFIRWLDGVTGTSAQFNASSLGIGNGSTVGFRSQAVDIFGNRTPAGNATASTTISSSPPTVDMTLLPTWTNTPNFTVSWTGNPQGGPAITSYNFQVSVSGGAWQTLLANTPQTSFQYSGVNGINYVFRAQASNNNGVSFGPWSGATGTTVDTVAPTGTLNPLPVPPQFTTSTSFWVSWSGTDNAGGSGVATYNVQYQIDGGAWQNLIQNTPQTSFYVQNAQTGQTWGFRIQAVDNAGNVQAWANSAQVQTTIFANPIAIVQNFNPTILQSTAPITDSFPVSWVGYTPPGTFLTGYTVLFRYNFGTWVQWSTFPATQTMAVFNWVSKGLGDGVYEFQATADNNDPAQQPLMLPQYAKAIIVDMADAYQVRAYLPLLFNSAP
jgi:hypothetical protein